MDSGRASFSALFPRVWGPMILFVGIPGDTLLGLRTGPLEPADVGSCRGGGGGEANRNTCSMPDRSSTVRS